ncbi:unannotated protein [freshwater metagenome]|uniref:Unannotated protein n=1 Tax=freshwater metagenome TaxID=449393 RepID=A0A6J7W209_9ZZZZ
MRRTVVPSSIPVNSPKITTPISRTSKFSARPNVPFSNFNNSLVIVDGRPSTRAMPSPASVTVPISSLTAAPGL